MNRLPNLLRLFAGLVLLTSLLFGAGPAWAATWHVVPSPSSIASTQLQGVSATSATDVWAVGQYYTRSSIQPLIEHYNGTAWSAVPSPSFSPNGYQNSLNGVSALSATDVWAVGTSNYATLIEHYNGTSWSVISSPNAGSGTTNNQLTAVSALSSSNVWAVGSYFGNSTPFQTLIEHYNGSTWSVVTSPNVGTSNNYLNGVSATSASDIWAVGTYLTSTGNNATLIEHYNGSTWSVVSSPNVGTSDNYLRGVSAISTSNAWAVGSYSTSNGNSATLIEHYNGSTWSVVAGPSAGTSNGLNGVSADSASDIWAVGVYCCSSTGSYQALIEHYNGTSWSVVASPNASSYLLNGVASRSAADVWAVGNDNKPAVIEHYNGTSWSVVANPSVTISLAGTLTGVAALSSSDVWAVGWVGNATLTMHYNGTHWSVVSSPSVNFGDTLTAVTAISSTDVWAVGDYYTSAGSAISLIEQYNGTSWSTVTHPSVGAGDNVFTGVSGTSASDVWAVGYSQSGTTTDQTLIEHYNGTSWSVVSSPNVGSSTNQLTAVSATSASDVWAVGYDYNATSHATQTLIEHYNGSTWSVVASPNPGSSGNHLNGVSATSASDVWAVGHQAASSSSSQQTLTLHYNGSTWSVVSSPNVGSGNNFLSAVRATSASDVWAVGDASSTSSSSKQTLIEHYNGSSWNVVSSPDVGSGDNALKGVSSLSASDVWAVGYDITSGTTDTLTERYS